MNTWRILGGDVRTALRDVPAGSVQCCVTSPPYWGLRDYGTAQWEGGDAECDHIERTAASCHASSTLGPNKDGLKPDNAAFKSKVSQFRDTCGKCGAKRIDRQIGQEPTPDDYVQTMVEVFREVRRVLHDSATLWVNLGDSFQDKQLQMIPFRVAQALQADGWWMRSVICWAKKSCMPESVTDRPTNSWEPIFLLAKSAKYFFDAEAVKEPVAREWDESNGAVGRKGIGRKGMTPDQNGQSGIGFGAGITNRNQRNVWHLGPEPYSAAHFATFPTEIPRRAILAGTSEKGCCPQCRAPWVRVVESNKAGVRKDCPKDRESHHARNGGGFDSSGLHSQYIEKETRTVGWEPGCECYAGEPIPCTVLDPFLGSGTTAAVAMELGRDAIGVKLNAEYQTLARSRIGAVASLFAREVTA